MADAPDHPDPKEATEAKLCAYLEGELSGAEQLEIEQHLSGNPQHRQLLADLARTRQWMRSVPHESIPTDIAEHFQGQVERAMLLDGDDVSARSGFNRWPQMVLVAAILLLTVGLGVVIVAMLRPPASNRMISLAKSSTSASSQPAEDKLVAEKSVGPVVSAPVAMVPAAGDAARSRIIGAAPGSDVVASTPSLSTPALSRPALSTPALSTPALSTPAPMPAIMRSEAMQSQPTQNAKLADRDLNDLSVSAVQAKLLAAGYVAPSNQQTICLVVTSDSPQQTGEQVRSFFTRHDLVIDQMVGDRVSVQNQSAQPLSTTNPVVDQNQIANAANGGNSVQQNQNAQNYGLNLTQVAVPSTEPTQLVYAAHGLTQLQLELLSASLATNGANQNLKRVTLMDAAATQPAVKPQGLITRGQMLSITIPQLVGPGIEKTNVVKVAEDGTIGLPMIDPVLASGSTPVELEQRIAGRYRDANLIPQAMVKVEIPAKTQPAATQPMLRATSQPSTKPFAAGPTTQPDAGICVVVLVERASR